ncbi:hypothetical protein PAN31117_05283 [Pandoraea anapnoica]|uniref:DUF4261 domain-containing protein n=2 Tax=Burkholderiaceae TaxID=119060 RepID=A0A5E5ATX9_9BURK|nr:hypothetical protein PIN31009_05451 [Pandoraea iniqua]VVE75913.1 hypothetical protein PAN31117_05283 [Pandoraea anapnoica]
MTFHRISLLPMAKNIDGATRTSMMPPLPDWKRDFHQASDAKAHLLYVVFGTNVENLALSRSKYRCQGIPDGVELFSYGRDQHPEVLDSFCDGTAWDKLTAEDPVLAGQIAAQMECVVLRGIFADETTLNYFRDVVGLLTCLIDNGGTAIYDPLSVTWWSPSEWKAKIFEPALPSPHEHVVILVSEERDGFQWFHTRGLLKYGRPDLSLHSVPARYRAAAVELFNRLITFQAHGGLIPEKQEIDMQTLPEGMVCVHQGDENDPNFNNVHVEITWPNHSI